MKRKITLILLVLAMTLCSVFAISACTINSDLFGDNNSNQSEGEQGGGDNNGSSTHTHEYGAWEIITPATCTQAGKRQRTCQCGHIETQDIPATGHSFNADNVCSVCGQGLEYTTGLEYELREENRTKYYAVTGLGRTTERDIVIPAYYSGIKVTTISSSAFSGEDFLTSVYIPNGITTIEDEAFYYCTSITNITLPESLNTIGEKAFYGCQKLNQITTGDGGIDISRDAFASTAFYNDNSNWQNGVFSVDNHIILVTRDYTSTTFTVGEEAKSIAEDAFADSHVTEFIIPEDCSLTISENALTDSEISKASVPANYLRYLPAKNITDLTIVSGSIYSISDFINVRKLNIEATLGGSHPLAGLGKLEELTIKQMSRMRYLFGYETYSGAVEIIDSSNNGMAYYVPASLYKITVKSGNLSDYAFINCSMLKELYFNAQISGLGNNMVQGCSNLQCIYFIGNFDNPETVKDYLEIEKEGAFNSVSSGIFGVDLPIKLINESGNEYTSITIPDGVTSIANMAFMDCVSLTRIYLPESVTSIGRSVFYGCTALQYNEYENALYLGNETNPYVVLVEVKDTSLTNYTINQNTKIIYDYAFYDIHSLTNITIPNGLTSICWFAFSGCSSLASIIIPESVVSIDTNAFSGCNSLIIYCEAASKPTDWNTQGWIGGGYYHWNYSDCPVVWDCNNNEVADDGYIYAVIDNLHYGLKDGKATVVSQPSNISGEVMIASTVEYKGITYTVTSIGDYAFYDCSSLTSITIPEGVTSIGYYAFSDCISLTSITIPESVTSIGSSTFDGCRSLTSITIPESVTSIGDDAFYDCSSLEAVYITDLAAWCNISFDGYYANPLYYADNLYLNGELTTELVIPEGVTEIKDYAFYNYTSLKNITIPEGVTSIGEYAFSDCSSLTSISLPDSVTSIGNSAFSSCDNLTTITIPEGVTSIGNSAFSSCDNLTTITIPEGVTSIGNSAFSGCDILASITIPDSVTSIGGSAFYYCDSLTSITIPDSVTSIGANAFSSCRSLTIYCEAASKPSEWDSDWNYSDCPVVWDCNNNEVADDGYIYVVIDNVCYSLKDGNATVVRQSSNISGNIAIPSSIEYNGTAYAVTSIGEYAFWSCGNLTSITIPNSVTSIGDSAFESCSSLTSITIPDSVTSIGELAFFCRSLTIYCEVASKPSGWSSSWRSSSQPVVWDCNNNEVADDGCIYVVIDNVRYSLKDGNATIVRQPSNISGEVVIPSVLEYNGTTYIVTNIDGSAFHSCSSITSITIPEGITSIGNSTFRYCSSLTSITIPESVTSIGANAFSSCRSLESVYYAGTAEDWAGISINSNGNSYLTNATRYYYSETEPVEEGNYWHYVDGVVTVW